MKNLFLTKTRWLVTIILLTAIGSGNVWGITTSDLETSAATTLTDGSTYVVATAYNGTYLTTGVSSGWGTASTSIGSAAIFTAHGSESKFYLTCSEGRLVPATSKTFSAYDQGTSNNLSLSASGEIQNSSNTSWKLRLNTKFRWYNSKTGSAVYLFKIKSATPSVTPDPTNLDWGTVLQGSSQENKTISITGANLTEGSLTISATGGYSVTPTSQNVNGTLDATDLTVTPPSTSTTGEKNGKVTISGGGLASDVEIDLSMTVNAAYAVHYYVNGSEITGLKELVASGGKVSSLPEAESCDAVNYPYFVGWSTTNFGSTTSAPSLVTGNETISSETTYYAVFAAGTGGNSSTSTIDFEGESSTYSDWKFTNLKSQQTGTITAKGGTYYGTTGGTTASVTTINKIASPTSLTAYVSKQTNNTTSSTWYIRVSSDGSTWTNVKLQSATSMSKGSWVEMTADLTDYSDVYVQVYYEGSTAVRNIDDLTLTIGGGTTYSAYSTSCQACVAPTSVTITGTNKYLGGQTISLTAAPEGGTGTPSYQWQKKISGVWTNLANDGSISGVASNNLQISSCTHANSGGYRCIVSTGDGCETKSHADDTNGYGVHVYSIHGKYTSDANYADAEIIWTSETTGTATISMDAKKTYLFKVWSNNGYYYGHGAKANEDFMFQPTTWDCGVNNNEMRLFTTVAGNYTFTVNIEHGLDGSPYVNVQVGYPSMTHPNSGYVYVQKFNWQPYLHYWYDNSHPLSTWGSDPQLAANQYTSICGTDYWCVPVIDYYCNFIAKDAAGNPSNTTGDQHTNSPHPGQRLYNNGSWKWGEFSTYTIAYAGGDGSTGGPMASHTGLCPGSSQQLTANAFSKSGYNFSGWTANVDVKIGGSTVPAGTLITGTPIIENVQSNITLTAQWRDLAQYHVTFSADNGTVAGGASQTVTEGGTLTFPNVTSTTCGTFSGWVEAAYDNTAAPSGATYHAVGDELAADPSMDGKTYYAVYHVAMGAPMKYQTSPACSPVINMTSSFSSFTYVYGSGPSASQSFTVSGANLGANLVVTAPANYEVCKTFGGDYTTSVSYTPSDGTVTDQTVYIRLKAGLNVGAYNYAAASGVSAASTGATTRTAALTGSVTKAAGAIAFTDFNAGDHYEAEWTGSAILVPYNYILTGDGTLTTTKVDGRGGTVDTENKKWSLTNEGTYQLRLTLGNGTNYTGAGPVTADFVIYKADRFYDNLHGNDVIVKRNDTGEDHYTIPSLTDESRQTSGSCSETHYHFMGWVPESALSTLSNDAAYDAVMITGGGTQAASGTNYYAVWAEE